MHGCTDARMHGAPGPGARSAVWLLNSEAVDDVVDCSSDTGLWDRARQWHNYGARV